MKKIIITLLSCVMLTSYGISDVNATEITNKTLYTDIIAKINGFDIASFNIDGYTAVVAEDLRNYGFNVEWRETERALYVTKNSLSSTVNSTYTAPNIPKEKIGMKAFDILPTDIKTYVNGTLVKSYNINGRTIIYFEDLSCFGSIIYRNDARQIFLNIDGLEEEKIVMYSSNDRIIYVSPKEIDAYITEGWSLNPLVIMYAPDGRTINVKSSEVEAYKNVGWYLEPTTKMYSADGRTINVPQSETSSYMNVGWYLSPPVHNYSNSYNYSSSQTDTSTVYITPTGKRYHRSLRCAGKNGTAISVSKAIARGYTHCRSCY